MGKDTLKVLGASNHCDAEFDELVDREITELKKSLPQSLDLDICCCAPEDLDDVISDMISEETSWLINGWESYEILKVK